VTEPGENDQGQNQPTQEPSPAPASPARAWTEQTRIETLAQWLAEQSAAYTSPALERSAIETGYTKAEFDEAVRLAAFREQERPVIDPLKRRARVAVVAAYGLVWLLFATQYLFGPAPYLSTLQLILTMSLLLAIALSMVWIHRRRPDPDNLGRALAVLLAVPLVLLVGVAGLCLPFLPVR
jgi:hypothetical protein